MHDAKRFKLHFGPYKTPRFKYGSIVEGVARGDMKISGITDAPIPWPIGKPPGVKGGRPSLILYKSLVEAVKQESNLVVAHWWGVSGQTVTKWRKALEVASNNEGTSRLRSAHALEEPVARGRRKAHAIQRDPIKDAERRAKISRAKKGKKRPAHVIEALRKAGLGRRLSKKTRNKLSDAHRKRGTRPPWLNPAWTEDELELLRALSPEEVASQTGRSLSAVYGQRSKLKLPDGRTTRHADNS
jgi:hypothetical protein